LLRIAGCLLALPVRRARLAIVRRGGSLTRTVRRRARLTRTILTGPRRIAILRIGAAELTLLTYDLAADGLRRMQLAHETLVARGLLQRNRKRHRGKACAARTTGSAADRKAARALRQRAEPPSLPVVDLDLSDPAIGIGIELDVDVVGAGCCRAFRHFHQAGGAANAECGRRRRDLHVAGLGDGRGGKGDRALGDVEDA